MRGQFVDDALKTIESRFRAKLILQMYGSSLVVGSTVGGCRVDVLYLGNRDASLSAEECRFELRLGREARSYSLSRYCAIIPLFLYRGDVRDHHSGEPWNHFGAAHGLAAALRIRTSGAASGAQGAVPAVSDGGGE